jgi:hypothetical protein
MFYLNKERIDYQTHLDHFENFLQSKISQTLFCTRQFFFTQAY